MIYCFSLELASSSEKSWIILYLELIIKLLTQYGRILYEKKTLKPMDYVP